MQQALLFLLTRGLQVSKSNKTIMKIIYLALKSSLFVCFLLCNACTETNVQNLSIEKSKYCGSDKEFDEMLFMLNESCLASSNYDAIRITITSRLIPAKWIMYGFRKIDGSCVYYEKEGTLRGYQIEYTSKGMYPTSNINWKIIDEWVKENDVTGNILKKDLDTKGDTWTIEYNIDGNYCIEVRDLEKEQEKKLLLALLEMLDLKYPDL